MYIDSYLDKKTDQVLVVERDEKGKRKYVQFPADYSFYYTAPNGKYTSMYGEHCNKFSTHSSKQFRKELSKLRGSNVSIFESDIKPVHKILETHYQNAKIPGLHTCFFDIEVDFHDEKGYALPEDPFNKITAISLYNDWENKCYSLVLAPSTLTKEKAAEISDEFENTFLCDDESMLLQVFLELIEDSDVLSGWNSEVFDIPYVVGRIKRVLGNDYVRKLCLWNLLPTLKKYERYGKEQITYNIFGRLHLDYLQLYMKFTYHQMHSYSLDTIGEHELKQRKVAYEGSLDDLYKYDFKTFIEYSRQDTMLLKHLDDKLKFIGLANTLAHENCVLFPATLGTVGITDQAIVIEYHKRGMVVPDRAKSSDVDDDDFFVLDDDVDENTQTKNLRDEEIMAIIENKIAGAYVADPKVGLNYWIGSVDITSLYPSTIMALNISPETIVGQLEQSETKQMLYDKMKEGAVFADAWSGVFSSLEADKVFERKKENVIIDFDDKGKKSKSITVSGQEAYDFIYQKNQPYCLSANGTIFRYDIEGVIPGLLEKWFKDRKTMQGKAKDLEKQLEEMKNVHDKNKLKLQYSYYDQRQLAKKIQMNALYGAITNPSCRFFDQRMGQTITLVGRNIARHMSATINEILTGSYDHRGECITYGDTDSAYFSAWPVREALEQNGFKFTEDSVIELYDSVANAVNKTFQKFMINRFNCHEERAKKIKANREICAKSALFVKKKRYAALMFDKEGIRYPGGKLKIMGMETQRADTPIFVQDFLKDMLKMTLSGTDEEEVLNFIRDFRQNFKDMEPWKMGTPKRCNKLTYYSNLEDKVPNSRLPGHIRAAYNWNKFKKMYGDNKSLNIPDGGKTIFCKLKNNRLNISTIAYPIDQTYLPDWFKELPFDRETMEFTLIDKKVNNLIGVIGWNLSRTKRSDVFDELFKME